MLGWMVAQRGRAGQGRSDNNPPPARPPRYSIGTAHRQPRRRTTAQPPALKHTIDKLIREGYCRACIKRRLQLTGSSANEVERIAMNTPRALAGVCVGCKADRGVVGSA